MRTAQYDNTFILMKGLAIISVVVGHCSVASVEGFVNQYHLATFYFISGYFFKSICLDAPKSFVAKRIRRLYVPFVGYGLMFLMLHNVFCHIGLYHVSDAYSLGDFVRNAIKPVLLLTSYEPFMGAMWFAPSLLLLSIVYLAIHYICRSAKYLWGGVICSTIIGLVCLKLGVKNPYCIWNAMATVVMFHLGRVCREHQLLQRYAGNVVTFVSIIFMVAVYMLGGIVRFQAEAMANNNLLLFFLVPLAGVTMVYGTARWIGKTRLNKAVHLCGYYSFEIMALHFISFKIVAAAHIWIEGGGLNHLADFPVYMENLNWWTPGYVVIGCAVPIMIFKCKEYLHAKIKALC